MNILLLLLPLGLALMTVAVGFFIWTVKSGHYEDLDSPARRVLIEDDQDRLPPEVRPEPERVARKQDGQADTTHQEGE